MINLSTTTLDLIGTLVGFVTRLQEKLDRLESLSRENQASPPPGLQSELRALRSEIDALAKWIDRSSEKMQKLVGGIDAAYIRALEILGKILTATTNVCSRSECYEHVLNILLAELHSDGGFILSFINGEEKVKIDAQAHAVTADVSPDEQGLSRTLVNELKRTRTVLRVPDALQDPQYSQETSILKGKVLSVLLAPLFAAESLIGCIYLESRHLSKIYTEEDEKLMTELSRLLSSYYFVHPMADSQGKSEAPQERPAGGIIGVNAKFKKTLEIAEQVANARATVLIEGESGTGKEVIARYIHTASHRKHKPLMIVNCAAIPETLIESELFGHEKGTFTGAMQSKIGKFELADGGTLFLDEIGELPLALQAKLLRFLQFQEFERLGGSKTIKVDARVLAATSRNLKQMVEQGKFLDALYFRINVIDIRVPPLRERSEDISLLTHHFLNYFCQQYGKRLRLDPEVYLFLESYSFPGNVRELENLIHRLVVLCDGDFIGVEHLPQYEAQSKGTILSLDKNPLSKFLRMTPEDLAQLKAVADSIDRISEEYKTKIEQRFYIKKLDEVHGSISELARKLAVDKGNLHRKLKKITGD